MLQREEYLKIIEELRNIEAISLDEYINQRLVPLKNENSTFIETLYKDIYYIIKDVDEPGDNDLAFENGDFVIEDGDFKLTGYQTRLHDILNWLHQEVVSKMLEPMSTEGITLNDNPYLRFNENMQKFEESFLKRNNYTPEYKRKLDKIKRSIRKEREKNYGKPKSLRKRIKSILSDFSFYLNLDPTKANTVVTIISIVLSIVGIVIAIKSRN